MTVIKAHFDGRVLIPDEAVALPINQALNVYVEPNTIKEKPLAALVEALTQMADDDGTPTDLAAQHDHYLHDLPKQP